MSQATRRLAPVLSLLALGAFGLGGAGCKSTPKSNRGAETPEDIRARADRYQERYHMLPGDARFTATRYPQLDDDNAYAVFARLSKRLDIERLALDDCGSLEDIAELKDDVRATLLDAATSDAAVSVVHRLRGAGYGYDFRIRETGILAALDPALVDRAMSPGFMAAARALHQRMPGARFPLVAIDPQIQLADVTPRQLDAALDRFAALEFDVGVRELNPRVVEMLAFTAKRPRTLEALALLRLRLREFDVAAITSEALETVAAVGSTALDEVLSETVGTRFGRRSSSLDARWAHAVAVLASQPGSGSVLALLDQDLSELRFEDESDARAVAEITAAGPDGRAVAALSAAFRAGALIETFDGGSTKFLTVLITEPKVLDVLKALHGAWPSWRATPPQLPAIRELVDTANLAKLSLTLERRLGFELGTTLSLEVARVLAQLTRDDAAPMVDALHLVFPRLRVQDAGALHELHELLADGTAPADVLRLDLDTYAGNLGPKIRSAISAKARAKRGG